MAKIKNAFIRIGRWFRNHAPTKRRLIQIYAALLFHANLKGYFAGGANVIYRGATKVLCTPGLQCYSCPGAITACPLGALQNAMAASKTRAPYYIVGILCLLGLMFGRFICGFLCPTGFAQELAYKVHSPKLRKSKYTRILSYFKYILLFVCVLAVPFIYAGIPAFCKYVCPSGTFGGALALLVNPSNADFFDMLGPLFTWKFVLLVGFVAGSIFIYRFFCRFFCPLGAILGFFNKFSLLGVCLDEEKCTECGLCIQTCKMDVRRVGDHECIACGECMRVCPTHAIRWKGSRIFLPASEFDTAPAVNEIKPLGALMATASPESASLQPLTASESGVSVSLDKVSAAADTTPADANAAPERDADTENTPTADGEKREGTLSRKEKILRRNFRLQMIAWGLALVVLICTLVYFNFLAPVETDEVYAVGDECPHITLSVFDSAGAVDKDGNALKVFDTDNYKGEVIVFNYWFTTCDPCKKELPYFAAVKDDYGDRIQMVVVHKIGDDGVQKFIDNEVDKLDPSRLWRDWDVIFALDSAVSNSFVRLGGRSAYPVTVIVDRNGKLSYRRTGEVSEEKLREEIDKALQA